MSRSYLFIPGNTPSMVQTLDVFESDAVILDLEDSVVYYEKDAARILVSQFLQQIQPHDVDVYVRINDINSEHWIADVTMLDKVGITGFVVPKASVEALHAIQKHTNKPLIPIIESPLAVLDAREIARHPQVRGLLLGAEDLTKEMNIDRTKQGLEIEYVRHHVALVCHAMQIEAIDTPWTDKDDIDGLHQDTLGAAAIGFTAKAAIHPNHVNVINDVFTPSKEAIRQAQRIVQKATETNKGAFSMDGKMIDLPIIEKAKKVLEKAEKYQLL